jgi:hypothetical protein
MTDCDNYLIQSRIEEIETDNRCEWCGKVKNENELIYSPLNILNTTLKVICCQKCRDNYKPNNN